MTSSILLQNGTLLLHDSNDHIVPTRSSLLIENNKIAQIAPSITPPPNCKILDCTNNIISPGFIDTHRHTWQTQLKGRHANDLLLDYMPTGNMAAHLYTPDDIYWGQLSGSLESLDAGTTTIIDHAHMNYSAEHNDQAIRGFSDSGIRGVFCYCANSRVKEWSDFEVEGDVFPEWWWEQMRRFAKEQPFADGRIKLGLGWDSFYLPREMVVNVFEEVRGMGVKLITCHHVSTPTLSFGPIQPLVDWGLMGPDILISHATGATESEINHLLSHGAHLSSTPSTELQMSLGTPKCFHPTAHEISSLGVDCHSSCSADIPGQMRLALQSARGTRNQNVLDSGKTPRTVGYTVEQAFNLGTILGARAIGMGEVVGKLEVGRLADIVVFDGMSTSMIGAAEHDPVAAVVLHSSIRDVDTVIVDGVIRKEGGKLMAVESGGRKLEWREIAMEMVKSRERIQEKVDEIDYEKVKPAMFKAFYIDEGTMTD